MAFSGVLSGRPSNGPPRSKAARHPHWRSWRSRSPKGGAQIDASHGQSIPCARSSRTDAAAWTPLARRLAVLDTAPGPDASSFEPGENAAVVIDRQPSALAIYG